MRRKDLDHWLWQVGLELQQHGREPRAGAPSIASTNGWCPRVDILSGKGVILVKVELAGVLAEDLKIFYDPGQSSLTIRGARRENEQLLESMQAQVLEIPYGDFERVVPLPNMRLVPTTIEAAFDNGLLIIWGRQEPDKGAEPSPIRRRVIVIQRMGREDLDGR